MTTIRSQRDTLSRINPILAQVLLLCVTAPLTASGTEKADTTCTPTASGPESNPASYRFLAEDGVARFPFDVYRGDVRFHGEINGHEVRLLLDDGFLWDELLLWGSPRVDSLGLAYDGEISVRGSADGSGIVSKTASGITLAVPGIEFTGQRAIVTPCASGTSSMWSGSEGQVSATFFKNLIIDINFDKKVISLIDPATFEYSGQGVEIPWKPSGNGMRTIPATLAFSDGRTASLDLAMDLGYNDQLLINTKRKHEVAVPGRSLPESLGFNIQGEETVGYVGRVGRVRIGGYEITDVVAAFIPDEHRDETFDEVMVGLGLLSRFNLTFDYSRQRIFVEPNGTFTNPFEYDMSGLSLKRGDGEYLEVVRVHPGSPASEAGLRVGDRITRINGMAATDYDVWKLRPLMRRAGTAIELSVRRSGEEHDVSIKLRRLI